MNQEPGLLIFRKVILLPNSRLLFRPPALQDFFDGVVEPVEVAKAGAAFQVIGVVQIAEAPQGQKGHTLVAHLGVPQHPAALREGAEVDAARKLALPRRVMVAGRKHPEPRIQFGLFLCLLFFLFILPILSNDVYQNLQRGITQEAIEYKP